MDHVPGIETADFEIVETAGSLEDLIRIFDGDKVVCNTADPFIYNGPRVIEAALTLAATTSTSVAAGLARDEAENWGKSLPLGGLWPRPRLPSCVR
jgi:hypothetical protein